MSDSVRPHRWQPTRLPCPWDSPGKNTGVGCHFLLQCMKVKSESQVAQSYSTLSDPMHCSLTGFSVHRIFQAKVLEWGAIAFSAMEYYSALKQWAVKPWEDKKEAYVCFFTWKKLMEGLGILVWFWLSGILEKTRPWRQWKKISDCKGLGAAEVSGVGRAQQTVRAAKALRVIRHLCPNPEQVRHQEGALQCELWTLGDVSV